MIHTAFMLLCKHEICLFDDRFNIIQQDAICNTIYGTREIKITISTPQKNENF